MSDPDEAHRYIASMQEDIDAIQRGVEAIHRQLRMAELATVAMLILVVVLALGLVLLVT